MRDSICEEWKEKVIDNIKKHNEKLSIGFINTYKQQLEIYNEKELFGKDLLWFDINIDMIGGPITTIRIIHGDVLFDKDDWLYHEFLEYIDFVTEETYAQMKMYIKDYIDKITNDKRSFSLQFIKSQTLYNHNKDENKFNVYEKYINDEFHKVYYEIKYTFDYVQNSL